MRFACIQNAARATKRWGLGYEKFFEKTTQVRRIALPRTAGPVLTKIFFAKASVARTRPASTERERLLEEERDIHRQWTHNKHEVRGHPFR